MNCMSKASESLSLNKSCSQAGLTLEQLAGATPRMYWAHCGNVGSMRQSGEKGVIGVEAAVDAATAAASTTPKNMRLRCKASLVVDKEGAGGRAARHTNTEQCSVNTP